MSLFKHMFIDTAWLLYATLKQSLKDTTCNQTKLTHYINGKDLLLVTLPSPSKNHLEKIRAVIINLSVIR